MFLALVLIMLGLSFLGLNLGLISGATFHVLWPLLVIFFGVYVLMKGHGDNDLIRPRKKKK